MSTAHYETAIEDAARHLETARRFLAKEIAEYPTPISGCDAQFNQLLSDRSRIASAISALETMPFVPTPRVLEAGAASETR